MSAVRDVRGRPLLGLAAILGSWLVMRVLFWEMPPHVLARPAAPSTATDGARRASARERAARVIAYLPARGFGSKVPRNAKVPDLPVSTFGAGSGVRARVTNEAPAHFRTSGRESLQGRAAGPPSVREQQSVVLPIAVRGAAADHPLLGSGRAPDETGGSRWSGDGWLMWREGSGAAVTPGVASYGRSQAGAVVRYKLFHSSPWRPTAYARVTGALQAPHQAEVAAGLAVRPGRGLPLNLAAEVRVTDTDTGRQVRPAIFAVTELPPAPLPLRLRGEAYLQAGYVGGRYRTSFIDGYVRVDREVERFGANEGLRIGVAAWGGAQRNIGRLDVGPSATLAIPLGEANARLAVDYRLRVAGDVEPASGPTLTLSAGF